MKTPFPKIVLASLALSLSAAVSQAATINLIASDTTAGTTSFNTGLHWSDGQVPNGANDYNTAGFFLRTPGDSVTNYVFAGASLTLSNQNTVSGNNGSMLEKFSSGAGSVRWLTINNFTNLPTALLRSGGTAGALIHIQGNHYAMVGTSAINADQCIWVIDSPLLGADNAILTNFANNANDHISYTGTNSGFTGSWYLTGAGNSAWSTELDSLYALPGNPSTFNPGQITFLGTGQLRDTVGCSLTNSNAGITLAANGNINTSTTTLIGEPITDLTNGVSALAQFTSSGTGTLILSNANNNWSGGTVVTNGRLQLGVNNAIPGYSTNGNVNVGVGATLDLNGHSATINGLNGGGVVDTTSGGAASLIVGANGANWTFSGTIQNSSGTLSLTKIGSGTGTLSSSFNYSGATTVAAGTLVLSTAFGAPGSPGDLIISNGAALNADVSSGNPLPMNNLIEATNSTLNLTLNPGTTGINASSGLTFQDNAINNLTYGTVTGNPTGLFINAAGGISAPGTNITINITAAGLQIGTFTLIKYTGTPLGSLANFQLNPPPGVAAVLVNNTGNDSIDIQITAIPDTLSWYGTGGGSWDLTTPNWSNDLAGGTTVFQQYTNNGSVGGDSVTFDDTLTNDFVNPQPTNITLNSTFFAFPVVVNSTLPYSISGTGGITGVTSLLKTNTGSLTLNVSNSYTGGTTIAGGTVIITNDSALGTNRGSLTLNGGTLQINGSFTNNLRPISLPAESTISVSAGDTVRLGGRVTGTTLDTTNAGTLVLGGTNIYSADLFVHSGTVVIDSGGVVTNSNYVDVGQGNNDNATLTLKGTGSLGTSSDFNVGDVFNSIGTLNIQDTASLRVNALFIGSAFNAGDTANGTVNQTGGTVTEVSTAVGVFAIGGRNNSGVGTYTISGGTLTANGGIRVGGSGVGTFNINGGTVNAIAGINIARLAGSFGTNNLNGGLLATFNVLSSTSSNAIFNFNGGTLQAQFNPANPWMAALSQANILAGGAFIDSSTNSATINQPLLAGSPNGGLTKLGSGTITLSATNSFTGPITNNAGTLVLNSASTYAGTVVVNAGTVSLTGSNTLQGGANINAGTLQMTPASQITGATSIKTNATLAISQTGSSTVNLGNLTFNGSAASPFANLTVNLTSANVATVPFINAGTLTLNGTNRLNVTGALPLGPTALLKYSGAIAGSGNITNLILPQGASGYVSNNAASSTLYVVLTNAGPGIVWTGTNSSAGKTNVWDILSTTNWLVNGTPTWYQQFVIPGDAVTFNDTGSGTVLLSNNVSPASILISNSTKNYTFSGTGLLTGTTGLTKLGTGTAIINLTNDNYSGNTVISNGTLQVGSSAAISPTANLVIGPSGTLQLAGNNQTAGDLLGSGIVDNNSPNHMVLTVGTASGGAWAGTIQDHGLGAVAIIKNGAGTWVVSGTNNLNNGVSFSVQDEFDGGTTIITNNGVISIPYLETKIANGANATSAVVVAGGILAVSNNLITIGTNAGANGSLIVNSGAVIHGGGIRNAFNALNNIIVGASNAMGTLTINGGQVLNSQAVTLGQNVGSSGTLNLNGGLLQATMIQAGTTPALSVANFNGGTLQAVTNNADFLALGVTYNVLSNGLVLDDNGFTLTNVAYLQAGDSFNGGVIKKGAGIVYFDAGNGYTGGTLVTNGTLAGVGGLNGPLVVGPAGNIAPGDAVTFAGNVFGINGNLTLQGSATLRVTVAGGSPVNDQIAGIATATYGGTLIVSNVTTDATLMTNGQTFQLFNAASGTGNFSSIVGSPGVPGLHYVFYPATGVLGVTNAAVVKSVPHFTHIGISGTTLSISATNGTATGSFVLLGSTNLALPVAQWTPLLTNSFDENGNLNLSTNIVNSSVPIEFYLLTQ